jgi:hypothetical protein
MAERTAAGRGRAAAQAAGVGEAARVKDARGGGGGAAEDARGGGGT